jgi:4-amino-4-deoxy-L-arabinose transferase-like glycosyltransferase
MMRGFAISLGFLVLLATVGAGARDSLKKGQLVKQFQCYSMTDSLKAHPWAILHSALPCPNPVTGERSVRRVEEPATYSAFAAVILHFVDHAAAPTLLISLLCAFALWLWAKELGADPWVTFLGAASVPVFLRYSFQHIPDPMAVLFLIAGSWCGLKARRGWMIFFFMLACTTKFTAIFAVVMMLAFLMRHEPVKAIGAVVVIASPFLIYLLAVNQLGISSPFEFSSLTENRHSGSWRLLFSSDYWWRFVTWTVVKGIGIPLSVFSVIGVVRTLQQRRRPQLMLVAWVMGLIPFWVFVRQGNFVHDYYFLIFFPPLALLGAWALSEVKQTWFKATVFAPQIAVGTHQVWMLEAVSGPSEPNPSFCGTEKIGP